MSSTSAGAPSPAPHPHAEGVAAGTPSSPGRYRYATARHTLTAVDSGDIRHALARAALSQDWIAEAPSVVVVTALDARTTGKYGYHGIRYGHMEVGHTRQNVLLQAVALGLGGAMVGAFEDVSLKQLLRLPGEEHPLAILPVGHPRDTVPR